MLGQIVCYVNMPLNPTRELERGQEPGLLVQVNRIVGPDQRKAGYNLESEI